MTPTRANLTAMLVFAAPVGVLLLSRVLAVQPPALMAQTDATAQPVTTGPIEGRKPTPQQAAALQRGAEVAAALMDTAPLYYAKREQPVVEPEAVTPEPVRVEAPKPHQIVAPKVSVSSIIRSADGEAIAFLNGKMHRVGDSIGDGWSITEIDPKARRVTIGHAQAQPVVVTLVDQRRP